MTAYVATSLVVGSKGMLGKTLSRLLLRKRGSKHGDIVATACELRDFIYLNVPEVSSLLEQLSGGIPRQAEISREQSASGQVGGPLIQIGGIISGTRGYREIQTIYWRRYDLLEKALREADKLLDLRNEEGPETDLGIGEHMTFLSSCSTHLKPDWANWQSLGYVGGWLVDKLRLANRLPAVGHGGNSQPTEGAVKPMLYSSSGDPVLVVAPDILGQLFPEAIPEEPPDKLREFVKPKAIKVQFSLRRRERQTRFEGFASLEHFSAHRLDSYLKAPVEQTVQVMGLTDQVKENLVTFIPLAIFVHI